MVRDGPSVVPRRAGAGPGPGAHSGLAGPSRRRPCATTCAPRCRPSTASRAPRGWLPSRGSCARCPTRAWATATATASPSCGPRSPHLSRARAACARAPSRSSSPAGCATRCRCCGGCPRHAGPSASASRSPAGGGSARSLTEAGLTSIPIPTDDHGLDPAASPTSTSTPSRSPPPTSSPPAPSWRPTDAPPLVAWARDRGALILEDDYDAEFRYDRQPIGSLQGLAPDLVVYGGSCSKTLAPALRLGWLVLPSSLVAELHADDATSPPGTPPTIDQLALADLIERGELDRHLRRQRHRYRKRRDALLDADRAAPARARGPRCGGGPLRRPAAARRGRRARDRAAALRARRRAGAAGRRRSPGPRRRLRQPAGGRRRRGGCRPGTRPSRTRSRQRRPDPST